MDITCIYKQDKEERQKEKAKPKKAGYNKKPKGEGFDQRRGTSCVHKQYKEYNWRKKEMTENQEREGDGQRGLKGKSRATFTPQKKTSSMPTWCMLHCLIG